MPARMNKNRGQAPGGMPATRKQREATLDRPGPPRHDAQVGAAGTAQARTVVPRCGEGQAALDSQMNPALAATITRLASLQRQRKFCIASQSRLDRSVEALIASLIGVPHEGGAPPGERLSASKERKAVFARASSIRRAVESDFAGLSEEARQDKALAGYAVAAAGGPAAGRLAPAYPLILLSAASREGWDAHRANVERAMRKLARTLPAWPFASAVLGFAELGLAIIAAEAGDLSNYATKERLWKRLGLAVIDGERQSRRKVASEAAAHGYSPGRRAEVWAIADSMFRHQWRSGKDGNPGEAAGPYGAAYEARKAATAGREGWTPAHRDADARRVMAKRLVRDVWRAWVAHAQAEADIRMAMPEVKGNARDVPNDEGRERA